MSQAVVGVKNTAGMMTYTRTGGTELERPYEKPVIVPAVENNDVATHAWADARFATDIMAEHAFFFALLIPEELAPKERVEALRFSQVFACSINSYSSGSRRWATKRACSSMIFVQNFVTSSLSNSDSPPANVSSRRDQRSASCCVWSKKRGQTRLRRLPLRCASPSLALYSMNGLNRR